MADQNPFSEFGGELKSKTKTENPFAEFGGELKKKESTPSGFSVTPLQSQDKFQQGLAMAQSPVASAVKKDTQKDNLFAGLYNTVVGSVKRLAGGAAYMAEFGGLVSGTRPEFAITRLASAENARKKTEEFVEKIRSEKSSKEYEEGMGKYDFTPKPGGGIFSGVDADDFKALAFSAPSQAVDMVMGGLTGGSSFVAQSVSDAANELNQSDSGKKMDEAQKAIYIFTQAAVQAALEKVSLDLILKNTGLGKAAKQKIANEVTEEFVKRGIKATAKDIEEAAIKKASTFANKAKRVGIKAAAGVATEGTTEGTQTAAQEGIKLLTNKIVDKDVFDEEDIIANLGKNIINASIGGAAFGGVAGGGVGAFQNTNKAIRDEVAKAGKKYFVNDTEVSEAEFNAATGNKKIVSDITKIQDEISKQVEEGNITPQEAEAANITAQQYAEIAGKIPTTVSPQDKYKIIGGIEQREALNARKQQAYDELTNLDPVFRKEKQDQIDLIQAKIDETNDYLEGIVSGKKPEYKEKRGMYFKVDSEGNETPINKETYDLAKSIREEDERKAKEPVDTTPSVIMPEENIAPEVVEPTRPAVIMPEDNVPAKTTVISPEQEAKGAAVVMPEANVAPEVAETVVTEEEVKPTEVKPEVKSKLESFKTKFAPQPKEVSVSAVSAAQKRVNRQEAAKIVPTDARGFALSWMNQSPDVLDWNSIKDLFGGRRARLNVKEATPEEIAKRDYVAEKEGDEKAGKNGVVKTIDDVVNDIWNNLPEGLEDKITTRDIKDELEGLISEYPTRADAAKALIQYEGGLKGKSMEEQQLAFEERKGIDEEEETVPVELEGGFVPFEEDIDIEGMEEAPFAVQEATTEEVAAMQDIVKDYIDDGTTSLSEIKKAIAKELGYNTKKLRQTIENAFNEYTKTQEAAPKDVVSGVVGRIGNALKKMFGKDAQKPFIAKDGKAMQAKLDEIREDVKFQIAGGFRSTSDMPIAYRYDTDQVARERYDIPKLKQIGAGSDRVVFDLGDGKVLKVAKTPRGLEQNVYEGDYYLSGNIIPEVFERGLNYVVVEKIEPPLKATKGFDKLNDLLSRIQKFSQKDFDQHNPELQDIMEEYEMTDIFNYDLLWNDFKAKRNWGLKDGQPLHLDGGSFGGIQMLDRFKGQKPLSDPDFRDIYNKSKKSKIENKDADKYTKFMATPDAEILGFTYNNRMYLNGSALNPNTPIHEAGHIWVEWTKTNDPKIYAKGMELVKDSPYYKKAKESKFYQEQANNLSEDQREDYYSNEALAMAIGDKGAQFVVESKREAFKDWLKTLWNKIKSLTGFKDLTEEQFQNLTFEEFSKIAVKEILGVENDLDKFQAARSMKKKKDFVKSKVRGEANKNAIDDFEVDDMIKLIKADYDLQTLKNIKDAIQKRSAEEVLPSQPSKVREPRGERKQVEPGVEGDETADEGEAAPTEGVEKDWQGAITIAANEERRQLLGLPEYQRERESFEQWTNDAIKAIKRGYDVEKLLDKMAKGYSPTPVENQIRKIYVAKLKSDYDKTPSTELEKKLIRYTELNDLANSTAGRQLRSIADVAEPRETLADFVIAKMKAAGVDELTEKQRKQVEKQYEEVKEKEAESQAKFETNDELNAKLLAEETVKNEKKARKPYQKTKDYKAERSSILESIREKLKKARSGEELTFVPVPYAKELIAISPDVTKLMKLYVEEGVDTLAEVVSKIYVDLRDEVDGLVEKDIFDIIAGRYSKERPALSEAQVKRAELKKEADLIAKIEDLLLGQEPKQEKAKIEKNQRLTQLRNQLKDLKRESGYYDLSKLQSLKESNDKKIKELDEKIKNGEFDKELKSPSFLENPEFKKKYPKEYDAYLDSVNELADKQHEFELALVQDEMKKTPLVTKIFKKWIPEVGNTIKALLSTIDDSFIFVQLGPAILKNPLLLPKVLNEQRKVIFNEGRFRREITALHEDKELWNIIQKSGLDILDPRSLRDKLREESMGGTNLLEREIGVGKLKVVPAKFINAPFERIATSAGNFVRTKIFLQKIAELEKQGKTIENSEKDYQDVARVINEMTGRGKLHKKLQGQGDLISVFLWSPKMLASTINLLGLGDIGNFILGGKKGYYGSLSPEMRKYAAGQFAGAIGMGALIMAAFALDDEFEVDYDPRSVTFGQIKHTPSGDAWNIFGRFTSVVRFVTLMSTGIKYIRSEAVPVDYGREVYKFIRGKAAPAPGLLTDAVLREKFNGEPFDYRDLPKEALTPLAVRDIKDALIEDGTMGLLTKGLPAFMGIKVTTEKAYNQSRQPLEDIIKKHARTEAYTLKIELKDPKTNEVASDKQYDEYVKKRDELITEKITKLYNSLVITDSPNPVPFVSLEAEDANKEISRVKSEATKDAKEYVFGKKKKTALERRIDRLKRNFRR